MRPPPAANGPTDPTISSVEKTKHRHHHMHDQTPAVVPQSPVVAMRPQSFKLSSTKGVPLNGGGGNSCSAMKLSVSMISLPPPTGSSAEASVATMRPFNSLKKKRNSDRDIWRNSWGSAHSQSSCSIHSNATMASNGALAGKDDFWAALQTNYNYIMDTNLLDSCKEALEGCATGGEVAARDDDGEEDDDSDGNVQLDHQAACSHDLVSDPRRLRRWLLKMEKDMARAPTLSEAKRMKSAELRKRLREHSDLYRQIVSQTREVRACIRTAEANSVDSSTLSPPRKSDGNGSGSLKGLETRYHMLYLQAFEVQCLLEGLLDRKESSAPPSRTPSDSDEPAAKLAKICCSQANNSNNSEDGITERTSLEYADETRSDDEWPLSPQVSPNTLTGFDADSEGSDSELVSPPILSKTPAVFAFIGGSRTPLKTRSPIFGPSPHHPPSIIVTKSPPKPKTLSMRAEFAAATVNPMDTEAVSLADCNGNASTTFQTTITSVVSVNGVGCAPKSPTAASTVVTSNSPKSPNSSGTKRTRLPDASKFNRSNRKSKNCATFYFKHSDTDGDTKGWSTQASESLNATSEEDEWVYSNTVGQNNDDSPNEMTDDNVEMINVPEKYKQLIRSSQTIDEVDAPQKLDIMDSTNGNNLIDPTTALAVSMATKMTVGGSESPEMNANEIPSIMTSSTTSTIIDMQQYRPYKEITKQYSKESIQQLVMDAETLVREEILMKTPTRNRNSFSGPSGQNGSTRSKKVSQTLIGRDTTNGTHPKIKRVQEWLQHQPTANGDEKQVPSNATTDCEASGEYTESDSAARDSDTSDVPSDSIATCLQDAGSLSQFTSTEVIATGTSADALPVVESGTAGDSGGASQTTMGPPKVVMRTKRRNSERPWSVSCLSQLTQTTEATQRDKEQIAANQGLANHSISESALHTLSSPKAVVGNVSVSTSATAVNHSLSMKSMDSKNSLKRRRMRARKRLMGRKSESGSNGSDHNGNVQELSRIITSTLTKSESFSGQANLAEDLSVALSMLTLPRTKSRNVNLSMSSTSEMESEEENVMMKPNFRLGAYTTAYGGASKLGSLAALATYNTEKEAKDLSFTGTDNSNFSEQAWDPYQEKYMSEAYSEGFDSDAARRLLEFGDDYRNFLDSQSDNCSSLSAANNLDSSLSPLASRRTNLMNGGGSANRSGGWSSSKSPSKSPSGDDQTVQRRRRAMENEFDRRREGSRKILLDEFSKSIGLDRLSHSSGKSSVSVLHAILGESASSGKSTKSGSAQQRSSSNSINRKLEIEFINNIDKRKNDDDLVRRRLRTDRTMSSLATSSSESAASDIEDESELIELLTQSKNRLENTDALRVRSHLLRPEDYAEIIATCRDNINCLESVLRGPTGTVVSAARGQEIREILSSWESLLHWSENASVARQLQEEMAALKGVLNKLGHTGATYDSEASIQLSIDELRNEKTQLHTHRSAMLRLNASVHSWLTRQELKMAKANEQRRLAESEAEATAQSVQQDSSSPKLPAGRATTETAVQMDEIHVDLELHKQLKNEVGDMYSAWDQADSRITNRLDGLTTSLIAWKQFESGLTEFKEALGKDKGALKGLTGALEELRNVDAGSNDVATRQNSYHNNNNQTTVPSDGSVESKLALDVKEVAKRLSEQMDNQQQRNSAKIPMQQLTSPEHMHLNPILTAIPFGLKSSSNGSLSDSGISDGGGSSDYGLSERERRLSALRRLARQLENALAPGSAALNSISQRMEAAEADLRSLQDTCRQLIVRTAASQQHQVHVQTDAEPTTQPDAEVNTDLSVSLVPLVESDSTEPLSESNVTGKSSKQKRSPQSKRKNRRRSSNGSSSNSRNGSSAAPAQSSPTITTTAALQSRHDQMTDGPQPDDPSDDPNDKVDRRKWARRVAKYAIPFQMALVAIICAVCCMEPHCCDSLNSMSMSFTPQLRYVKGPPPI